LVYERADSLIPINMSQQVNVLECLLLGESQQMLYPESSFKIELPLNENFRADLTTIDDLGEIVAVYGTYINSESIIYEYPIYSYWVTSNNELAFNSPMKYMFTDISIEYIPQLPLIYNSTDGYWYLPDSAVYDQESFVNPFFVSSLYVNNSFYGTYVHPDVDVNYTVGTNSYGTFVAFTGNVHADSLVRGAVHFGKINNTYLYRIYLADDLLYQYNVLEEGSDVMGGTLQLDLNVGFKDVLYSELSQVASENYQLLVNVSQLDTKTNELKIIGRASIDLDSSLLGFHNYKLDIPLKDDFFELGGQELLKQTLTRGTNYDLFISVESSLFDCIVDGNLFKGVFAQELIRANFMLDVGEAQLIFNGTQVDIPYIPIFQEGVPLTKIRAGLYEFNSLDYSSDFIIETLYTDKNVLFESSSDYIFNSELNKITLIGSYRDYSGKVYANITYKTFEWNSDFISTLEPITFTFDKDYLQDITKYLEFIIQYNKIPGYETEKIDSDTGRVVLSDEKKSPTSLNIYLYNFVDDTWDLVNFIVYSDYSGTNSFSYVVDRNFITFEQYFNKTSLSSEEFQLKTIFTIEEDIGEYFISTIGFDINSINSSIYYNTPNTEHTVNPEVIFDIDLTDYYTNPEIYLEQVKINLDYYSELEFDNAFLFSDYMLLQEQDNFYLRNEYLEFELFELDEDVLSLSRKELERIIYHDIENDKYFLRAKIEYDFECIIEINLGSNSKLEILSKLSLVKYDLSVSYSYYETTRISAQEIDVPFELTAIFAPNYIEASQTIYRKADDDKTDIGVFGGYLCDSDTNQRLMLRQMLYYNFTGSQEKDSLILLDHEYTDSILQNTVPYGKLIFPIDYLINTTDFMFIADEDVISVEFYYHNGTDYVKNGDMLKDSIYPEIFTYTWINSSLDTEVSSGEVVKILLNITNLFGYNGEYEYFLIADYDKPSPTITAGSGTENFEEGMIADPSTPFIFNSNEIITEDPQHYSWYDNFTTFDSSNMAQSFYPDGYSSLWNMNPLNLYNQYPTSTTLEDFNGWNLDYDPEFSISSFDNTEQLKLNSSVAPASIPANQPDGFSLDQGMSDWAGDLNAIDDDYTTFSQTYYPGTYSFEDDTDGGNPSGWSTYELGGTVAIESSYSGHAKIVKIEDTVATGGLYMSNAFTPITSGDATIEFWHHMSDYNAPMVITVSDDGDGYFEGGITY
ncbi:hypothetical protein LCGC14_1539700, partial [marine sediment metagenome]